MCDCDSVSSHTPSALIGESLSSRERDTPNKLAYLLLPEQYSTGMPLCTASPTHVTHCPGQASRIVCSVRERDQTSCAYSPFSSSLGAGFYSTGMPWCMLHQQSLHISSSLSTGFNSKGMPSCMWHVSIIS